MSNSQKHGLFIENWCKAALAPGQDVPKAHNDEFDLRARYDLNEGLDTSIKSAKIPVAKKSTGKGRRRRKPPSKHELLMRTSVSMSDARCTLGRDGVFRLLVAPYVQCKGYKDVRVIYEFRPTLAELIAMRGTLTLADATAFHEMIKTIARGKHRSGRKKAQVYKRKLMAQRRSAYTLNPKIGAKDNARRLQCSITLRALLAAIADVRIHRTDYLGSPLPLRVPSTPRGQADAPAAKAKKAKPAPCPPVRQAPPARRSPRPAGVTGGKPRNRTRPIVDVGPRPRPASRRGNGSVQVRTPA